MEEEQSDNVTQQTKTSNDHNDLGVRDFRRGNDERTKDFGTLPSV
jgi:hypothetical protein